MKNLTSLNILGAIYLHCSVNLVGTIWNDGVWLRTEARVDRRIHQRLVKHEMSICQSIDH